jgi:cation transport ATPase
MANFDQSETPRKSLTNRATTAGAYAAGVSILLGLIIYLAGMNKQMMADTTLKWLNNLLLFAILFYFVYKAAQQYRDIDRGGYLSIGNGLGLGTLAGVIAGLISAVWTVVFMIFIAPEMSAQIKEITMEQMAQSGQSEEKIEEAMKYMDFFLSPTFFAIMVVLFYVFLGFLAGLVSGLMLKKERPVA